MKGKVNQNYFDLSERKMKNMKKKVLPLLLVVMLMCSAVASAEVQGGNSTQQGVKVFYSLDCTFKLLSADAGRALTTWSGKTGYKVQAKLYQCQNIVDSYHLIGSSTAAKAADAQGSVSGVWKFQSKHYIYTDKTSTAVKVCEFTDW